MGINESKERIMTFRDLKVGDHIKFNRGAYDHHEVVIGKSWWPFSDTFYTVGYSVDGTSKKILSSSPQKGSVTKKPVKFSSLDVNQMYKIIHEDSFSRWRIVRNAKKAVGKKGYSFLTNNCEHLANEVVTGHKYSTQVQTLGTKKVVGFIYQIEQSCLHNLKTIKDKMW